MFTTLCLRQLALKGYRLVVVTPVSAHRAVSIARTVLEATCTGRCTAKSATQGGQEVNPCDTLQKAQGNKPPEILQVVQALGPQCDQTIILG
jgi:hypothetical protein